MGRGIAGFFALLLISSQALATPDAEFRPELESETRYIPQSYQLRQGLGRFDKTVAVFENYGIPLDTDPQPALAEVQTLQTPTGLKNILTYFNSDKDLQRLATFSPSEVTFFQDVDTKQVKDFSVQLAPDDAVIGDLDFERRIKAASTGNPIARPLVGLRIALDPGHMVGNQWDNMTGKWVRDKKGNKLREGLLTVQTALLLKERLEALGAEVMVTRHNTEPATPQHFQDFDFDNYSKVMLKGNCFDGWFLSVIDAFQAPGPKMFTALSNTEDFKKIFAPIHKFEYYNSSDLRYRAVKINEFNPDITLVIHYDTTTPSDDPMGLSTMAINRTKVFVPGAVTAPELARREDRMFYAFQAFNPKRFEWSLNLGRFMVKTLSQVLKMGLDSGIAGHGVLIEPGVIARNLLIPRQLNRGAVSYVEVMFYNDVKEFNALRDYKHDMYLDGQNYPYSDRLVQIVDALEMGVVGFVKQAH